RQFRLPPCRPAGTWSSIKTSGQKLRSRHNHRFTRRVAGAVTDRQRWQFGLHVSLISDMCVSCVIHDGMMSRLLTRRQMLVAAGISGSVFDRMIKRGGMALTFGVMRAPVANRYIATDPIFARVVIDLAAASRLPQPFIATLVRLNNVVVLETIVRAE